MTMLLHLLLFSVHLFSLLASDLEKKEWTVVEVAELPPTWGSE